MARQWTAEDQARFDAAVERVRASEAADQARKYVDCAHCEDVIRTLFQDVCSCPGCGAKVCSECYSRRRLFSAQSCRTRR